MSKLDTVILRAVRRCLAAGAEITTEWLIAIAKKAKKQWRISLRLLVENVEVLFMEQGKPRIGLTQFLRNSWFSVP